METRTYGIVFCGGGAKGAYQIGVWRFLRELGLDQRITGISGASIGAINSMLFAQGDYKTAEEVWRQTRSGDILAVDLTPKKLVPLGMVAQLSAAAMGASVLVPLGLVRMLKRGLPNLGLFSQRRLQELIRAYVPPRERHLAAGKEIYTVLTVLKAHVPKVEETAADPFHPALQVLGKPEYRGWAGLSYEEIVETVLASAAIPMVYPASRQKTGIYVDGGVVDNTPVKPLADAGFQNIIVVHLEYQEEKERRKKERQVERQGKSWTRFIHIWPSSKEIGGTLEIHTELTNSRMELGYRDAQAQLEL